MGNELKCFIQSLHESLLHDSFVWCCSHEGMIDVKSRRCAAEGCNKYPAFNLPGENTARFCGDHRQPGMIDVHNKRCAFEGCQKRPTFNYVGKLPLCFKEAGLHMRCM